MPGTMQGGSQRLVTHVQGGGEQRAGSSTCCMDAVRCCCCTEASLCPSLREEGAEGRPHFNPTSGLILCALFDETWTGRWALSDAQSRQLLYDIQADGAHQRKDGRLSVEDILLFFNKEAARAMVKTMPTCAHGLLFEDSIRKAFSLFDREKANSMDAREWSLFLDRLQELHLEYLLETAFKNFHSFFGRGQRWSPRAQIASPTSLASLRRDLVEAAGSSCVRTSGDAMLGSHTFASSLAEVGIASKLRLPFQLGCDDDCMTSGYSPFPPGCLEDLHYYSANNHPLHGIFACDECHPLTHAVRLGMELAAIGLSLLTLHLRSSWTDKEEAPFAWLADPVLFGLVMVAVPGMAIWWTLFLLFTCGKCGSFDRTQASDAQETAARRCGCCGEILGYMMMLVCLLGIAASARLEGPAFRRCLQLALLGRLLCYALAWLLMATLYFNPIVAWGQPDPNQGFNLGDYIGLGQWRIEKQRFQARCLQALEATYVNGSPADGATASTATTSVPMSSTASASAMGAAPNARDMVATGTRLPCEGAEVERATEDGLVGGVLLAVFATARQFVTCMQPVPAPKEVPNPQFRLKSCCFNEKAVVQENWRFVGKRRGDYEKLQQYNFVGDGLGSYQKKQVTTYNSWRLRRCCVWMAAAAPLALALGLVFAEERPDSVVAALEALLPEPRLRRSIPAPPETLADEANGTAERPAKPRLRSPAHKKPTKAPAPSVHNCSQGEPDSWSRHKQAWCCISVRRGCGPKLKKGAAAANSSKGMAHWPSTKPFDCDVAVFGWNESWPPEKRAYCCEKEKRGCQQGNSSKAAPSPSQPHRRATTAAPSTTRPDRHEDAKGTTQAPKAAATAEGTAHARESDAKGTTQAPKAAAEGTTHARESDAKGTTQAPKAAAEGTTHARESDAKGTTQTPKSAANSTTQAPKADAKGTTQAPKSAANSTTQALKSAVKETAQAAKADANGTMQAPKLEAKGTTEAPRRAPSPQDLLMTRGTTSSSRHTSKHQAVRVPVLPPEPAEPAPTLGLASSCKEVCSFRGHSKSCEGHIQWAAGKFYQSADHPCDAANHLIVSMCPMCSQCSPGHDGCTRPAPGSKPPA